MSVHVQEHAFLPLSMPMPMGLVHGKMPRFGEMASFLLLRAPSILEELGDNQKREDTLAGRQNISLEVPASVSAMHHATFSLQCFVFVFVFYTGISHHQILVLNCKFAAQRMGACVFCNASNRFDVPQTTHVHLPGHAQKIQKKASLKTKEIDQGWYSGKTDLFCPINPPTTVKQ